jgi:hypothetical protein
MRLTRKMEVVFAADITVTIPILAAGRVPGTSALCQGIVTAPQVIAEAVVYHEACVDNSVTIL